MSKELLIDASHPEETRIAIKSDRGIEEYEYENIHRKNLKGNIYLGKVSRIEPSLQAAFVDFGNERHGFLAFNDIQSDYYQIPQADKDRIKKEEEEARAMIKKLLNMPSKMKRLIYKIKIHPMVIRMKKISVTK
jgi:ribonuclease E